MRQSGAAKDVRIMKYSDATSMAALWWKVVFLLPIWGFIPCFILGAAISRLLPQATEVGYLFVVFSGIAYFLEDVLKRKIKVADGILYSGYRTFDLSKLKSITVGYESNKIIPKDMLLTFQNGYILPIELARIEAKDVQYIVKLVDTQFPHCFIDSTLRTLSRCHELSPRLRGALELDLEVPYHAQKDLIETYQGFMSMLASWARLGPLLVWMACSVVWLGTVYGCFNAFRLTTSSTQNTNVSETLIKFASGILSFLSDQLRRGTESFAYLASNPIVGLIGGVISIWLLSQLLRKLNSPNLIVLNGDGITFFQSLKWFRRAHSKIRWSELASAELFRPSLEASPDQWKIVLRRRDNKVIRELAFTAMEARGRADLYDRLKHFAPGCLIAPELAETLMQQQQSSYTELWLQSLSTSPNRDNLDPLDCGDTLNEGRYQVIMKLGVGGQGAAYLCRENAILDQQHCQEVVLKETILPIFVEDSVRKQSLERFEHEARTLNLLSHENIVKLSDYFVEDHRGYLVLEHIEGTNLREYAKNNPLSESETIDLALQMCDMLSYLHERNVIHRDFTPDNLIREPSGILKLIDFNVAQTTNSGMTGTVVGKHAYVPPEQFRGKAVTQSDIYALGCTLFYALTGHDPEPITQSSPLSESKRTDISQELDLIIKRCTSLKAEARFPDAETLRQELLALQSDGTASGATLDMTENLKLKMPAYQEQE